MDTLFVINWNGSIAYMKTYSDSEEAQAAAWIWSQRTDSLGHKLYRVFLGSEYW